MIWVLLSLYFTWLVGSNLEHEWGALKFNVFYLLGAVGTAAAGFITGTRADERLPEPVALLRVRDASSRTTRSASSSSCR